MVLGHHSIGGDHIRRVESIRGSCDESFKLLPFLPQHCLKSDCILLITLSAREGHPERPLLSVLVSRKAYPSLG